MKSYVVLLFACFLLALGGCKKYELPQPVQETPQVWLEFKLDGKKVEFKAGINATYATTYTNVVDREAEQFVFNIESEEMKKVIEIGIHNYADTVSTFEHDLENSIKPGSFKYLYSNAYPDFFAYHPSELVLLYWDKQTGNPYYTGSCPQDSSRYFYIASVKDVIQEGKKFKLAEVYFSCKVKNPYFVSKWLDITEGHGFIPFGDR